MDSTLYTFELRQPADQRRPVERVSVTRLEYQLLHPEVRANLFAADIESCRMRREVEG